MVSPHIQPVCWRGADLSLLCPAGCCFQPELPPWVPAHWGAPEGSSQHGPHRPLALSRAESPPTLSTSEVPSLPSAAAVEWQEWLSEGPFPAWRSLTWQPPPHVPASSPHGPSWLSGLRRPVLCMSLHLLRGPRQGESACCGHGCGLPGTAPCSGSPGPLVHQLVGKSAGDVKSVT